MRFEGVTATVHTTGNCTLYDQYQNKNCTGCVNIHDFAFKEGDSDGLLRQKSKC